MILIFPGTHFCMCISLCWKKWQQEETQFAHKTYFCRRNLVWLVGEDVVCVYCTLVTPAGSGPVIWDICPYSIKQTMKPSRNYPTWQFSRVFWWWTWTKFICFSMGSHPVSSTSPAIFVVDQESGNALLKLPQGTLTFFSSSCSFQEPTNPLFRFGICPSLT